MSTSGSHWLQDVVRDAGLPGAERLSIPRRTGTPEAWEMARGACGVSAEDLARHVARHFHLELADLGSAEQAAIQLLPERLAQQHRLHPLRQDDRQFVVATADPTDLLAEKDVSFATGRSAVFEVAPPAAIQEALTRLYGMSAERELDMPDELTHAVEVVEDMGPEAVDAREAEAAPVVRLTNFILRDAVRSRASDIHLEPGRGEGTVRFRIDGVMRVHMRLPMRAMHRVISRVKVIARLDIADRLRPQDGRTRVMVEGRTVELRVSTVPTREAEKAVLRVLAQSGSQRVNEIFLPEGDVPLIEELVRHRDGIVIVTGPTGSGKTTTLYAIVRELANGEVNVMTVEDPVEYEIPGITQIQVEPRRNVTFATALRAILRQDPDIILVGEIRDLETAEVALQASMTGHLVLGTLHTNHAAGAISRLADLGVDRPSLGGTLRGVIAQRLVRRLCPDCASPVANKLSEGEELLAKRFGANPAARAVGCVNCGQSGYVGRLPITEVLRMNLDLVDRVVRGAASPELERAARAAGMHTLRDSALERVRRGDTTLEEVERVLGERAGEASATPVAAPALAPPATASAPALSLVPPPVADVPPDNKKRGRKTKNEESSDPPPHTRVLVVDDDPVHRSLACRALEKAGFEVDEAGSGAAALEKAGTGNPYALVVTDLNMPGLGGREVVACLRALPSTAGMSIVVATSEDGAAAEAQLIEAGADDYIRKPLEPARFVARVKAALRRAAA